MTFPEGDTKKEVVPGILRERKEVGRSPNSCPQGLGKSGHQAAFFLVLNMAPAFMIIKLQTLLGQKNTRLEEKGGEQQLTRHLNSEPCFSDILLDT